MRLLAIDPGDVRIGLAISDADGKFPRPHSVIKHSSRQENAEKIARIALEHQVGMIIVGQALDADNRPTLQSRKAKRLAAAIIEASAIDVILWDESGSSQKAAGMLHELSAKQRKNRDLDDIAASMILQNYIDAHRENS
jgi:putative Holliday junction resolvase